MRFIEKVKFLLGLDFARQASDEVEQEEEQAARKVATRFSRGNARIQRGAFQTRKDLDRDIEKVG